MKMSTSAVAQGGFCASRTNTWNISYVDKLENTGRGGII